MTLSFSSLSGGTSFTVITSTGGSKTATLSKTFPAGTYLIESMAADTNLEVYLGASDGTQVGSCVAGAKSVTASASFLYVTTVNADTNDAVTFTLKSAATLATKTDAVWAPPTITDITPSGLPNINDTTTITGTNFATNVEVKFRKSDDSTLVTPKSTVRGSATSIIAGRPDSFAVGDAPYDVIVTNPSTNLSASSLNAITAGAVPVWVTSTTLNLAILNTAFSQTIQATDADGGSSITYAIVSGALQTGLSLNSSTGVISGTPTGSAGTTTVTISATDSGGNSVNRTFTQVINPDSINAEILVIAGGGGGGHIYGNGFHGGGGAGGLLYFSSQTLNPDSTFTVTVGAGGQVSTNGENSSFSNLTSAIGGGRGAAYGFAAGTGGSGGGGAEGTGFTSGAAGTAGQGNSGGIGQGGSENGGGGGGGAGSAGGNASGGGGAGGAGLSTYSSWGLATSTGQNINGTYWYAGGGGGTADASTPGAGGAGGGGIGSDYNVAVGGNGLANTGGGGGGGGGSQTGGVGGSGLVIVKYAGSQRAYGGTNTITTGGYTYHVFKASGTLSTNNSSSAKAIGGSVTTDGSYWIHTFNGSGIFTPSQNLTNVDYLVVAGGGGTIVRESDATYYVGGAGGGGLRTTTGTSGRNSSAESKISLNSGTPYTVTVGAGGATIFITGWGGDGGNSSISGSGLSTITSLGGAGGANNSDRVSRSGGCGAGAGGDGGTTGGLGTAGQGFDGGNTQSSGGGGWSGAGGGGAGGNGGSTTASGTGKGGTGGAALSNSISGSLIYYSGGGAGGQGYYGSSPAVGDNGTGYNNIANRGMGGKASLRANLNQASGGSGVVIIRYPV